MNDRFLFRAWHPEWGEMVYSVPNPAQFEKRSFAPLVFDVGFSHYPEDDKWVIMQCAGFRDKTGKKIFESDVLKRKTFGETVIGEVVWTDMGFTGFKLKVKKEDGFHLYPMGRGQYDDDEGDLCNDEIIGNIHENPELLE